MKISGKSGIILGLTWFLVIASTSCGFMKINYKVCGSSPAQSGIVQIYDFSSGTKGSLLAESNLENGFFEFALNPDHKIFLLELKNFVIFDPFNNIQFFSHDDTVWETLAIFPKPNDREAFLNINPITTITSAFTKFKIKYFAGNHSNLEEIISQSSQVMGKHFGGIDIMYDIPGGLDTRSARLSNGIKYASLLLSFFETSLHNQQKDDIIDMNSNAYNIINFTEYISDDIVYDGILNGVAAYGNTALNNNDNVQILKADLAASLYRIFQNKSINLTGLTYHDFYDFLNQISTSRAEIFNVNSPVYSFDIDPPTISCPKPLNGSMISGFFEISCSIADPSPGVESTRVYLNGSAIQNEFASPETFFALVDSLQILTSLAEIEIITNDKIGNVSSDVITITLNN